MLKSKKIRLKPTPEQEDLFWKSAGVARWAYNYFLSENKKIYAEYQANGNSGVKYLSGSTIRKRITALKHTECAWLAEVSCNVAKQAVKDAELAFKSWLSGKRGKPKYRTRDSGKIGFYVNYESLTRINGGFRGERIGIVKTTESLPKIPNGTKYSNPRISYDGRSWYISVGYPISEEHIDLTDVSLGIDLGIKSLAVCSDGSVYKNINKTAKMKKLNKRLAREQRRLSKKLENNTLYHDARRKPIYKIPLSECSNIQKQKNRIQCIHRRIKNIRMNYLHQTTTNIIKTRPYRIVMESLNIRGMMKNKHLSKSIQSQGFFEFKRQITYKCEYYGIEFVSVPRNYPSSKTCSCCGHVKTDLRLSDRVYTCNVCGLVLDRDLNASINLANYKLA